MLGTSSSLGLRVSPLYVAAASENTFTRQNQAIGFTLVAELLDGITLQQALFPYA